MRLFNTLTKQVDTVAPLQAHQVTVYSCGPTVYDHIHIVNLSAFIYADLLSVAGFDRGMRNYLLRCRDLGDL